MKRIIKKAFTMAEVLMVVAIIGAVAVLAVPNLKTGISEDTNIAKLKATYSQLETAISAVIADYGSWQAAAESCGGSSDNELKACFNGKLAEKLDLQKNCSTTPASCISSQPLLDIGGDAISNSLDCSYAFVLSNGATICHRNQDFGRYEIDVDGPKKGPNQRGVDIFTASYEDENRDILCAEDFCSGGYTISHRKTDGGYNGDFHVDYDITAWAMMFGNMDYVKCADQLNWHSKTTCD